MPRIASRRRVQKAPKGLHRVHASRAPEARDPLTRRIQVRFASPSERSAKPAKARGRFARRNEAFRISGRKSLKSLWSLNQRFRGIVCFQWLNRLFVSPHSRPALVRTKNPLRMSCPRTRASSLALPKFWIPACAGMTRITDADLSETSRNECPDDLDIITGISEYVDYSLNILSSGGRVGGLMLLVVRLIPLFPARAP